MGFIIEEEERSEWIERDRRNAEVLFPYLNGEDLNGHPEGLPSRWVIDFNDRSEEAAKNFELPYVRLRERVKPDRAKKAQAVRAAPWWLFFRSRPALRKALVGRNFALALTRVSKTAMPLRVSACQVFSDSLTIFADDSFAVQATLSSSLHQTWAVKYGTTMRTDPTYNPRTCFETFPRPICTANLTAIGETLDTERREMMSRRKFGLTTLYNRANDPDITDSADPDSARLRQIHVELDEAVMAAYGWDDVPLQHGFHTYRQMRRWTVSPTARVEILDRLLEENHRRAATQGEAPPPAEDVDVEGEDE